MTLVHVIFLLAYEATPPVLAAKTVDIENLKRLTRRDTVSIIRKCKDFEGRENYLAISSIRINRPRSVVMTAFSDPMKLKEATPEIRELKILERPSPNEYSAEFVLGVKLFAGIRISVKYVARTILRDEYIYTYIIEGKNKGGWRVIEFFDDEGGTVVTFTMCEYIRTVPIASEMFENNPHYEMGILSSSVTITLTRMKSYIEGQK